MSQIGVAHIPRRTRIRDLRQIDQPGWGVEFGDHVVDQDDGVASTQVELGRISLIGRASNLAWGLRKVRNTRDDLLVPLLALRGVIARFLRVDTIDIWSSRSMQARAALLTLIHQRTRQSH